MDEGKLFEYKLLTVHGCWLHFPLIAVGSNLSWQVIGQVWGSNPTSLFPDNSNSDQFSFYKPQIAYPSTELLIPTKESFGEDKRRNKHMLRACEITDTQICWYVCSLLIETVQTWM